MEGVLLFIDDIYEEKQKNKKNGRKKIGPKIVRNKKNGTSTNTKIS